MSYEARVSEIARAACSAHGGLKEVVFLRKTDDSLLVFGDGTVAPARGVCDLLTFGYQGTGPTCYQTFLGEAGFAKCNVEEIDGPLRRKKNGAEVAGQYRNGEVEWADGSPMPGGGDLSSPSAGDADQSAPSATKTKPCRKCGQPIPAGTLTCKSCGNIDWGAIVAGFVIGLGSLAAGLYWFEMAFWKWGFIGLGALCLVGGCGLLMEAASVKKRLKTGNVEPSDSPDETEQEAMEGSADSSTGEHTGAYNVGLFIRKLTEQGAGPDELGAVLA